MEFKETELKGVYVIENRVFKDERGKFVKTFNFDIFKEKGIEINFKESFYTFSKKGVIRGMHFQTPPMEHDKLVYVSSGKIIDVILDLRKDSPTFGKHISVELSEENGKSVFIPKGFAHGFQSLEDDSEVVYLTTSVYSPDNDGGVFYDSFEMQWPLENFSTSDRDKTFPKLNEFNSPF
jgi:dTDP-4-dehydrorhamnose 3,5-epimerase